MNAAKTTVAHDHNMIPTLRDLRQMRDNGGYGVESLCLRPDRTGDSSYVPANVSGLIEHDMIGQCQ